jgi:anti-anti-sigma factor
MAFSITSEVNKDGSIATITMVGEVDSLTARSFKHEIESVFQESEKLGDLKDLVLELDGLEFISSAGLRVLIFSKQSKPDANIYFVKAKEDILDSLKKTGLMHSVTAVDEYPLP